MRYEPKLTKEAIAENHKRLKARTDLYKASGLDFMESRQWILDKAGSLRGKILEIGTGTGHTAMALGRAGYSFISIDRDEDSLKVAAMNLVYEKVLSNAQLFLMDAARLEFEDRSMDAVITVNFFHHVQDPGSVLSEIDRVLKSGGRAVLADFNERGMRMVDSVHESEGRVHENSGIGEKSVEAYFSGLGYDIRAYEHPFHWILVADKGTKSQSR